MKREGVYCRRANKLARREIAVARVGERKMREKGEMCFKKRKIEKDDGSYGSSTANCMGHHQSVLSSRSQGSKVNHGKSNPREGCMVTLAILCRIYLCT